MEIAILLYNGLTVLDAVGPYEVLAQLPNVDIRFVARQKGAVRSDGAMSVIADYDFDEVTAPNIIVVPGGFGTLAAMSDLPTRAWLQKVHQTSLYTTSVCSGSLILAAAGLLKGLKATCHWNYLERLKQFGAEPTAERVVAQNKIITAAGVSAGIDMALRLIQTIAGDDAAKAAQLVIEYDPEPPFQTGSPKAAKPEMVEAVSNNMSKRAVEWALK
jgi:transcriptional regulator GlxA family with amidase domain